MLIRLSENFRAVFYAPFYATIGLGFFAREGVEIQLVPSSTPGSGTQGLVDGSIDVTWGGPMRVMKSRDEVDGPALVCFGDVVRKDPFYLLARTDAAPFALADLARLKIGSVSEVPTPWLCLQHDLREIGIDPGRVARIADRSMGDNVEALRRGEIDIAQVFEPFASKAVREGFARIVHAQSARGDTAYTTFLTTKALAEKHATAYTAMTRAIAGMQGWMRDHSADDLVEAAAPYFSAVDRADLASAFTRYKAAGLWATDTAVSRAGFERLAASLVSGGFIRKAPAYEDCVINFPVA